MIRHINDVLDYSFNEYSRRFPAFCYTDENGNKNKPILIPAQAIANDRNCPMYFKRLIDLGTLAGDPYYLLFKANPLKGDASRRKALEFFDDFLYNKLRQKSSFDKESRLRQSDEYPLNGTMTREQAINAEVLPADDNMEYRSYYEEQIRKAEATQAEEENAFERKHGFRRDDPSIIGVGDDMPSTSSREIQNTTGTAVGMPKQIWYGVCMHIPSTGTRLGYDDSNRLYERRGLDGYLRESGVPTPEKDMLEELIKMAKPGDGFKLALQDIYEKFFGKLPDNLNESNISWGARAAIQDFRSAIDRITNGGIVFDAPDGSNFKDDANALFDKYFSDWGIKECDRCGDPECKDGEICGLKEDKEWDGWMRDEKGNKTGKKGYASSMNPNEFYKPGTDSLLQAKSEHARQRLRQNKKDNQAAVRGSISKILKQGVKEELTTKKDAIGRTVLAERYGMPRYYIEFYIASENGNINDKYGAVAYGGPNEPKATYTSKSQAEADARKFSMMYTRERADDIEIDLNDPDQVAVWADESCILAEVHFGDEWENEVVSQFLNGRRINAVNEDGTIDEKHVEGIDNVIDALDKVKTTSGSYLDEFEPEADGSEYYGKVMEKVEQIPDDDVLEEDVLDENLVNEMVALGRKIR